MPVFDKMILVDFKWEPNLKKMEDNCNKLFLKIQKMKKKFEGFLIETQKHHKLISENESMTLVLRNQFDMKNLTVEFRELNHLSDAFNRLLLSFNESNKNESLYLDILSVVLLVRAFDFKRIR